MGDKFPVSVPRLVCLLQRLDVPQLSLETLKLAFASALPQSPEDSRSVQQLMPLKEVLDLICPLPEQPGRLLRCLKAIQKCALCFRCRCRCGRAVWRAALRTNRRLGSCRTSLPTNGASLPSKRATSPNTMLGSVSFARALFPTQGCSCDGLWGNSTSDARAKYVRDA